MISLFLSKLDPISIHNLRGCSSFWKNACSGISFVKQDYIVRGCIFKFFLLDQVVLLVKKEFARNGRVDLFLEMRPIPSHVERGMRTDIRPLLRVKLPSLCDDICFSKCGTKISVYSRSDDKIYFDVNNLERHITNRKHRGMTWIGGTFFFWNNYSFSCLKRRKRFSSFVTGVRFSQEGDIAVSVCEGVHILKSDRKRGFFHVHYLKDAQYPSVREGCVFFKKWNRNFVFHVPERRVEAVQRTYILLNRERSIYHTKTGRLFLTTAERKFLLLTTNPLFVRHSVVGSRCILVPDFSGLRIVLILMETSSRVKRP
jgi:hypothetical protein